jgi:hypothetical protein
LSILGYDITRLRSDRYSSFSCPNPARAPVSHSHASYQGEIRAEASSLRAINISLKKKAEAFSWNQSPSHCLATPSTSRCPSRTHHISEALHFVSAILPRTIRLCVGNEHHRPCASLPSVPHDASSLPPNKPRVPPFPCLRPCLALLAVARQLRYIRSEWLSRG